MKPEYEMIRAGRWCRYVESYIHPRWNPCPRRCGMKGTKGCVCK